MSAREEAVSRVLVRAYGRDFDTDDIAKRAVQAADRADVGRRKPRTITTPEELDALPSGTSILWGDKVYGSARVHQKGRACWFRPGRVGHTVVTPSVVYPATVLHEQEVTK